MNLCFDANNTSLSIGDAVICIQNGNENERLVKDLLSNNKIVLDGENGVITVNASDTFYLSILFIIGGFRYASA